MVGLFFKNGFLKAISRQGRSQICEIKERDWVYGV